MMNFLLSQLADEMLLSDIDQRSTTLGRLSNDELRRFHDQLLEQYALELLIGAHENSEWSDGKVWCRNRYQWLAGWNGFNAPTARC